MVELMLMAGLLGVIYLLVGIEQGIVLMLDRIQQEKRRRYMIRHMCRTKKAAIHG